MSSAPRKASSGGKGKPKAPRCKTCDRAIRVPEGWARGSAVRRHYWAKHPEVMRGDRS